MRYSTWKFTNFHDIQYIVPESGNGVIACIPCISDYDRKKIEDEILSITDPEYNFLFEACGVIIQE